MSTNSPKILKGIRAALFGFSWLFVLVLAGVAYKLVAGPGSVTATVGLAPQAFGHAASAAMAEASLHVAGLNAVVVVPVGAAADAGLKSAARLATLPWMFVAAAAGLILCEIARRIVVNLEAGELFSERNRKLLRNFALVLIAATVLERAVMHLGAQVFGRYAAAHLTVAGEHVVAVAGSVGITGFQLDLGNTDMLIGLLLLLIVWAFKQGVAMQRESELTI